MDKIQPDTIVVRLKALASKIDHDLVFFDVQAGKYFATGMVGADIWDMLETPRSVRDICADLTERYEVSEEKCLSDVQEFVSELIKAGLAESR